MYSGWPLKEYSFLQNVNIDIFVFAMKILYMIVNKSLTFYWFLKISTSLSRDRICLFALCHWSDTETKEVSGAPASYNMGYFSDNGDNKIKSFQMKEPE